MRRRLLAKLLLALASAVFAGGATAWWIKSHGRRGGIDTRLVERLDTRGEGVAPRPSGYRARPLTEAEYERFELATSALHQRDEACFYRYRAGIALEYDFAEHPGGRIAAATNDYGLRGRHAVRLDRPELRILTLGDSHTDGVCDPEVAHPALVRDALRERGRDAEALNAGVGGYTFHHYIGALERYLPLAPDVVVLAMYGGNDFQECLVYQHLFAGSAAPESTAEQRARLERGLDVDASAMGQGLSALRYFADHPEQLEIALQSGREALNEFATLCREHGARPVFVYIPPAFDVAWEEHARVLQAAYAALELEREEHSCVDRLADRLIAHVRSLGIEVVDLRPAFRAAPRSPYWALDFHINLEGQKLVASAVTEVIERLCPAGFERTAPAPRPELVGATVLAAEFGEGFKVEVDDAPLEWRALDEQAARRWFSWGASQRFDPRAGVLELADATRAIGPDGAWSPASAAATAAAGEVWVLGDELGAGSAAADARFGALLEQFGPFVCRDFATRGHGPQSYLGLLEPPLATKPRAIVVLWNGGNDFAEALSTTRALTGDGARAATAGQICATPEQVVERWRSKPREPRAAAEASTRVVAQLRRRAEELGARLVVVLLRPNAGLARSRRRDGLDALDRVATAFGGALRIAGYTVIDESERLNVGGPPALDPRSSSYSTHALRALAELAAATLLE
ncbi:MAG: SGNH/GDSL hydrolase family protein [Planctomycetes bacterium]|nr:SGNH/GDSL hydrolase family protein [Planctomycetota bacterium]